MKTGVYLVFWWRWMMLAAAIVMLSGLMMVLLPDPTRAGFNWLYFGSVRGPASFSAAAVDYLTFVYGVLGSVMLGWGAMLFYVVAGPFRRRSAEGWNMVAISLLSWFVPDSAISLWLGMWPNMLLNLSFGVLFGVPLLATYRVFHPIADSLPGALNDG